MIKVLLTVLIVTSACTAEQWRNRGVLVASNAVIACDLSQTMWMADHGKWDRGLKEADPLLGQFPSDRTILLANLGAIAVNTALYFVLPKKWAFRTNLGIFLVEGANVTTQPNSDDMLSSHAHHGCDISRHM